jgi:hypothetical protein
MSTAGLEVNVSLIGEIRIITSPAKLGGWMGGEVQWLQGYAHSYCSSFSLPKGASSMKTGVPELLSCFANSLFFGSPV